MVKAVTSRSMTRVRLDALKMPKLDNTVKKVAFDRYCHGFDRIPSAASMYAPRRMLRYLLWRTVRIQAAR